MKCTAPIGFILVASSLIGAVLTGCGQGSGRAGKVPNVQGRASAQMDAIILTRHWLRAFYPDALGSDEILEITPPVYDDQGRARWKQIHKSGTVEDILVYPDGAFEMTSTFPDKSQQKTQGSAYVQNGNIITNSYAADFSDGVRLEHSWQRDNKGDFNIRNDEVLVEGRFDFPDGSDASFHLDRLNLFDHLKVELSDGRRFEITANVRAPNEKLDSRQPVEGKLESGDQVYLTFTLRPDPNHPDGWLWEAQDPSSDLAGIFRLTQEFSGFGQWGTGDQVESTASWQMPSLPGGSGGLPGKVEVRVTLTDAQSYIAGPSAAALAFLNRYWNALVSISYPASQADRAVSSRTSHLPSEKN